MIGQLPYIGQSDSVYGSQEQSPTAAYTTLNGLAGSLLGSYGSQPPSAGYGATSTPAQQTGAINGYLTGAAGYRPAPPQQPYGYGSAPATYATRPPVNQGPQLGWTDGRTAVTGYAPATPPQTYVGSYQQAYPPVRQPYAQYPPTSPPVYSYSPAQQMQTFQGGYQTASFTSGMFGWGGDGSFQGTNRFPGYAPRPTGGGYAPRPTGIPQLPGRPVSISTFGTGAQAAPPPLTGTAIKPTDGFLETSSAVATRLIGSADNRNAISFGGQDPRTNTDGRRDERLAVWDVMRLDDSLLYDADRRMLVRPFSDGSRRDVAGIDAFQQIQAEHPDDAGLTRLFTATTLGRLPAPETLLGSAPSRGQGTYERVPPLTDDPQSWKQGSPMVKDRLVGNSTVQAAIHYNGQDPRLPDDFQSERSTVWSAFQATVDMRYNVDTQTFFVTRPDGSTSNVAKLAEVQRAQADGKPLESFFMEASLRPSPTGTGGGITFGSAAPNPNDPNSPFGSPNQTSATGATLLPPFGTFGTTPDPAAAQTALNGLLASDPNSLPLDDFLNQIGAIRQTTGSRGVAPVNGPGTKGPFTVVAHRYFDSTTGQYVPVADVLIAQSGQFSDRTRNYNPAQFSDFEAVKPDAEVGKYYQVTVTWADGKSKVWDYRMDQANGTRVDMWSPVA